MAMNEYVCKFDELTVQHGIQKDSCLNRGREHAYE